MGSQQYNSLEKFKRTVTGFISDVYQVEKPDDAIVPDKSYAEYIMELSEMQELRRSLHDKSGDEDLSGQQQSNLQKSPS